MATKEKQIEEMAFDIVKATSPLGVKDLTKMFDYKTVATDLYNAGYRKIILCDDCYLQGSCIVEDTFNTARMADSMKFCAVGKRKGGAE